MRVNQSILKKIAALVLCYFILDTFVFAEDNWPSLAKHDLEAINKLTRAQTPGAVDKQNPSYREWMVKGLNLSGQLADKARTYKGYVYALEYYVNGFHDEHFQLKFMVPSQDQVFWPGFLTHYEQEDEVVSLQSASQLTGRLKRYDLDTVERESRLTLDKP